MIDDILEKDKEIIEEEIKPLFNEIYDLEGKLKHQAGFYKISTKRELNKKIKSKKKEIMDLFEELENFQKEWEKYMKDWDDFQKEKGKYENMKIYHHLRKNE